MADVPAPAPRPRDAAAGRSARVAAARVETQAHRRPDAPRLRAEHHADHRRRAHGSDLLFRRVDARADVRAGRIFFRLAQGDVGKPVRQAAVVGQGRRRSRRLVRDDAGRTVLRRRRVRAVFESARAARRLGHRAGFSPPGFAAGAAAGGGAARGRRSVSRAFGARRRTGGASQSPGHARIGRGQEGQAARRNLRRRIPQGRRQVRRRGETCLSRRGFESDAESRPLEAAFAGRRRAAFRAEEISVIGERVR